MSVDVENNKGNMVNNSIFSKNVQNNVEMNSNIVTDIKTGPLALFNAWIGNMTIDYVANFQIKKQNFIKEINQNAVEKIPECNLAKPRINIVGPTLDGLKYNLDEEHIKEKFSNLLVSELDDRKQNKVLPAYIEIVKQLSNEDAQFILFLKNNINLSVIQIRKGTKDKYYEISNHILINIKNQQYVLFSYNAIIIDNLKRLGIIDINYGTVYIENKGLCKKAFNELMMHKNIEEYFYTEGILELTKFGQNFIDICCS